MRKKPLRHQKEHRRLIVADLRYSKDGRRLLKAPLELYTYSIPYGTKIVCNYAFNNCQKLSQIEIPESISAIGTWAFAWCAIQNIIIPESVMIMGNQVFHCCLSLKKLLFHSQNIILGDDIVSWCGNIENIYIPAQSRNKFEYSFKYDKEKLIEYSSVKSALYNITQKESIVLPF